MAVKNILGSSAAFPLRLDGRGGAATVRNEQSVADSIKAIISSPKGSHVFEPWLGWPLAVFMPVSDLAGIAEAIKDAIREGESRVNADTLRIEVAVSDEGMFNVAVVYSTQADATDRTLQTGFRVMDA